MDMPEELQQKEIEKKDEDEKKQKNISERIFFSLIKKDLTSKGGNVAFLSTILFLGEEECVDNLFSNNQLDVEIKNRFQKVIPFLSTLLKEKKWAIDLDYFFDYPPSKTILLQQVNQKSSLVYFHLVPYH